MVQESWLSLPTGYIQEFLPLTGILPSPGTPQLSKASCSHDLNRPGASYAPDSSLGYEAGSWGDWANCGVKSDGAQYLAGHSLGSSS